MKAILGEFSMAQNATLLSLDIDGVLHASDAHFSVPDLSASSVRVLHYADLFQHRELLAEVLEEHPHVVVAVHGSWRLNHDLNTLRQPLPGWSKAAIRHTEAPRARAVGSGTHVSTTPAR